MKVYKFKTNINCGGCISGVTPFLNRLEGIKWEVDTNHPDKVLTVQTDEVDLEEIIRAVKKAGFEIEVLE